jgi:hypothetical protein
MKNMVKGLLSVVIVGCVLATSARADFPLQVDIDVRTKRDSKNIGAGSGGEAKVEKIALTVKIRKAGGQPYTKPLTAELYVIGRQIQTGYYGIIGIVKQEFSFSPDNDNIYEFTSPMYLVGQTSGNINVGGKYETYLIVIADENGDIIDTRAGRAIRKKGIDFIRELGPKTLFDRDGNVVGSIDNSAFKIAVPAAVSVGGFGGD